MISLCGLASKSVHIMEALLETSECYICGKFSSIFIFCPSLPIHVSACKSHVTKDASKNVKFNLAVKSLWYCCWWCCISSFPKSYNYHSVLFFLTHFYVLLRKMVQLLSGSNNLAHSHALSTFLLACPLSHERVRVSPHFSHSHFFPPIACRFSQGGRSWLCSQPVLGFAKSCELDLKW